MSASRWGSDYANTGTTTFAACTEPGGCQKGTTRVLSLLTGGDPGATVTFETQGPFDDPRYLGSGACERVELPLDFTGIPVLQEASIGPEFCARDGVFFVDILSAPGVTPTSGFTRYETPGECWMPGFGESIVGGAPATSLNDVEYGILFGDEFDLLRNSPSNIPIQPGESYDADYVTNRFGQDNLVGCTNPRVRAGGRFTFIIEDFVGNDLMGDIGAVNAPIGDNILYQYGEREAIQRIEIPVQSPQSGCFDEFGGGPSSPACTGHVAGMNAGLAGWNLQRVVGAGNIVSGDDLFGLGIDGDSSATVALGAGFGGLDLNITASDGDVFRFKTVNLGSGNERVLGLGNPTSGEIAIDQSVTFTVEDVPLAGTDVGGDLPDDLLPVQVPFRVSQVTTALQFDGPEFNDVQETVEFIARLVDGTIWTGTLINLAEDDSSPVDAFGWTATSSNPARPAPAGTPVITVLSGDNSSSEFAVFEVGAPFEDEAIVSLDVTAVTGEPSSSCDGCSNQSEASIYDIGIEGVDRVQALSFAYSNYLRALCHVSTRPDFSDAPDETRPKLCTDEAIASQPAEFNLVSGVVERNIAGYQQADLEGVLRFIAHNICELDYGTAANPGGVTLADGGFCETVPEWAPTPASPPVP